MSGGPTRLLFVPVSAARGMGEYGRSLAMARAFVAQKPDAVIHFALSREAAYAAESPFPATLLPSSPTFHTPEVVSLIETFEPHVVIFDNAGRTAQLRAARRCGARVVFVSARAARRHKAFRLRWMRLLDEHWIAYPRVLAGDTTFIERMKLRLMRTCRLRFMNPLLPAAEETLARHVMERFKLTAGAYVLVVPGGGTEHAGTAEALREITRAAQRLASHGIQTLLVGLNDGVIAEDSPLHIAPLQSLEVLAELLRHARVALVNGGYTLVQALACDRPCVAVALAKDQARRIERCVTAGLALRGSPHAEALESAVVGLLNDDAQRASMRAARARHEIGNGARAVVDALEKLAKR